MVVAALGTAEFLATVLPKNSALRPPVFEEALGSYGAPSGVFPRDRISYPFVTPLLLARVGLVVLPGVD